jgi:ATP-dependent RNA helicase DDX49/DBP8
MVEPNTFKQIGVSHWLQ